MNAMVQCTVQGILLDIEGTTSSISFVHEVLFPYARTHLVSFLQSNASPDCGAACEQIAKEAGHASVDAWCKATGKSAIDLVIGEVHRLMDGDVKSTGLKALQGMIWAQGYHDGSLVSHVYPEVIPQIRRWRAAGFDIRIYSSGSVAAQRLFFGHVKEHGDCLALFTGHYDTTIGSKKEAGSYRAIAQDWGIAPRAILFISDIAAELGAAFQAGFQVAASVRPGNAPLPAGTTVPQITSFEQLQIALP